MKTTPLILFECSPDLAKCSNDINIKNDLKRLQNCLNNIPVENLYQCQIIILSWGGITIEDFKTISNTNISLIEIDPLNFNSQLKQSLNERFMNGIKMKDFIEINDKEISKPIIRNVLMNINKAIKMYENVKNTINQNEKLTLKLNLFDISIKLINKSIEIVELYMNTKSLIKESEVKMMKLPSINKVDQESFELILLNWLDDWRFNDDPETLLLKAEIVNDGKINIKYVIEKMIEISFKGHYQIICLNNERDIDEDDILESKNFVGFLTQVLFDYENLIKVFTQHTNNKKRIEIEEKDIQSPNLQSPNKKKQVNSVLLKNLIGNVRSSIFKN